MTRLRALDWWSAGAVTFQRFPMSSMSTRLLREIDERAFDGYHGQYDTGFGRRGYVVVAAANRSLVGYVLFMPAVEPGEWYLDTVAVVPERQAEGLGAALVIESARWMYSLGVPSVTASALVGEDQDRRERWLLRLGFTADDGRSLSATPEHLLGVGAATNDPGPG